MKKLLKKSCCIIIALSLIMSVPVYSFADTELTSTRGVEMSAMASKSKPSKPIITVKPVNNDYIKVSWKKCKNASKYLVYRKVSGGKYKKIATTSKMHYNDYAVRYNVKYYYKVIAKNKSGAKGNFSSVKYNKIKLNTDCYYGFFGIPDFGKAFNIGLEDYYMDEYCIGFIYRGGSIIKAGYEATEIIDLYSDLLQEYGFDYHGMTLVDGTFLYFFSRNYLDDDVTILYDSHGITIEIGNC